MTEEFRDCLYQIHPWQWTLSNVILVRWHVYLPLCFKWLMFNLLQIATRDDKRTLPHQMVQFCDDNKRVDYANAAGRRDPRNSVPTGRDPSPCLQRWGGLLKKKTHFPTLASPWCVFYCLKLCQILLEWNSQKKMSLCTLKLHIDLWKCMGVPDTRCMRNYREFSK